MSGERKSISVMVPCYNEEKTIERTLLTIFAQTRQADQIVVVNDGSTDRTLEILERYRGRIQIVDLQRNTGNKSRAQEQGLRYIIGDIMVTTDADTRLEPHFIEEVEKSFEDIGVAAVSGYVESLKDNWLTALREIDYVIGQHVYKEAQSLIGHLMVIPGCAAAFRTDLFRRYITFDHDTITEDMDFTYKFHEIGLRIDYNRRVIAYTQDPSDVASYRRQMKRWYGGGWQNLRKHFTLVYTKPAAALVSSMSYIEGMINSFFLFALPIISLDYYLRYLAVYLSAALLMGLYAAIETRRYDLIAYAPLHIVLFYLNVTILWSTFFKEFFSQGEKDMVWLSAARKELV